MRRPTRAEKIALLNKVVNGQANRQDLKQLAGQRQTVWFMVVTDNGDPQLTDLVDTRLPNEQGQNRMPYADFIKNPVAYGRMCITVD